MVKTTCSILIVDADHSEAKSLAGILKQSGHSVLVARDAGHAVSILEFRGFDVLIVDLASSHLQDLDLIGWACCLCPKPRIVATGYPPLKEELSVSDRGADLFLRKPVDTNKLTRFLVQSRSRSSFSGKVNDVDIIEYVQFVLLCGGKTILEVTSTMGTTSRLFISEGQVVHAECGVLQGEQALYRSLGWREGSFSHAAWAEPGTVTINKPGEFILVEAVRKRDDAWNQAGSPADDKSD